MFDIRVMEDGKIHLLYRFICALWAKFTGRERGIYDTPNTCIYARVFFLQLPFLFLVHLVVYMWPLWIGWFLVDRYGTSASKFSAMIIGFIILVVCVICGIVFGIMKYRSHCAVKRLQLDQIEQEYALPNKPEDASPVPTAWEVFCTIIRNWHNEVCQPVTVISAKSQTKE